MVKVKSPCQGRFVKPASGSQTSRPCETQSASSLLSTVPVCSVPAHLSQVSPSLAHAYPRPYRMPAAHRRTVCVSTRSMGCSTASASSRWALAAAVGWLGTGVAHLRWWGHLYEPLTLQRTSCYSASLPCDVARSQEQSQAHHNVPLGNHLLFCVCV